MENPTLEELDRLEYELEQQLLILEGRESYAGFIHASDPDFLWNWHHQAICEHLDKVETGEITRLIVTAPPRHGKSETTTRKFPAYIFGRRPDWKVMVAAYGDGLARKFSRATQKIMKSQRYSEIFPHSHLVRRSSFAGVQTRLTNRDFELPHSTGIYICGGIMAGLTGEGADLLLIDDPFKNRKQADSATYRERIWEEYINVLRTRVMPGGRIVIITTRWHEDDLVGRLLLQDADPTNRNPEGWVILNLEAIKETPAPYDPRAIGEALWPDWYNLQQLQTLESSMGTDFTALFQGRPTDKKGNIVLRDWFNRYDSNALKLPVVDFFIDCADEDKEHNDRTAIIAFVRHGNDVYLTHGAALRAKFPDRVRWIIDTVKEKGNPHQSRVWIEPKSSGIAIAQYLQESTSLNVIKDSHPQGSKESRLKAISPRVESGRVWLPAGAAWTVEFLNEVCGFPKKPHDDYVDCLVGAVNKTIGGVEFTLSGSNYGDH